MNLSDQLSESLAELIPWHKARIKFLALFILALIRRQTVNTPKLAVGFNPRASTDSSQRCIERFFAASHSFDIGGTAKDLIFRKRIIIFILLYTMITINFISIGL